MLRDKIEGLHILFPSFCQFSNTVLFYSFIMKSNIFFSNYNTLFPSSIQVLSIFQHIIIFTVKSKVYFNNYSILFSNFIQVYQFSVSWYFINSNENLTFFEHLIPIIFQFV